MYNIAITSSCQQIIDLYNKDNGIYTIFNYFPSLTHIFYSPSLKDAREDAREDARKMKIFIFLYEET
jgi:hypothetical protein